MHAVLSIVTDIAQLPMLVHPPPICCSTLTSGITPAVDHIDGSNWRTSVSWEVVALVRLP